MIDCPVCKGKLMLTKIRCGDCGLAMEGSFTLPRLARLPYDMRLLAEQMILCGGNLKQLSAKIGVSYPTLRRKVDQMIEALGRLKAEDEKTIARILQDIEDGRLKSEEGIRMIKEIQSEI